LIEDSILVTVERNRDKISLEEGINAQDEVGVAQSWVFELISMTCFQLNSTISCAFVHCTGIQNC